MPWEYDQNHSTVGFAARHLGISTVRGRFNSADVKINLDGEDPTKWSISATIQTASIDTGIERRDDALRAPAYFDVEAYPTMSFESRRVEPRGEKYALIGDITMHGTTKEIELITLFNGEAVDREVTKRGFSAEAVVDRFAFGVGNPNGSWSTAAEVRLELEMEAIRKD